MLRLGVPTRGWPAPPGAYPPATTGIARQLGGCSGRQGFARQEPICPGSRRFLLRRDGRPRGESLFERGSGGQAPTHGGPPAGMW